MQIKITGGAQGKVKIKKDDSIESIINTVDTHAKKNVPLAEIKVINGYATYGVVETEVIDLSDENVLAKIKSLIHSVTSMKSSSITNMEILSKGK